MKVTILTTGDRGYRYRGFGDDDEAGTEPLEAGAQTRIPRRVANQ